jgi:hypothetical protein
LLVGPVGGAAEAQLWRLQVDALKSSVTLTYQTHDGVRTPAFSLTARASTKHAAKKECKDVEQASDPPVSMDSSSAAWPSSTSPSTGTRSPAAHAQGVRAHACECVSVCVCACVRVCVCVCVCARKRVRGTFVKRTS